MTRRQSTSSAVRNRRVTLLTLALLLLCGPLLLLLDGPRFPAIGLALLTGAVVVAELRPVHIGRAGARHSFTVTEGPFAAALAIEPSREVVAALMAGMLVAQLLRRLPRAKAAYNVAQIGVAGAVATLAADAVGGLGGTMLGVLLFTLLSERLVSLVIAVSSGQPLGRPLQDASLGWLLHLMAVGSVGFLAAQVYLLEPSTLPAFAAPAALALWLQDQSNKRRVRGTVVSALAAQATSFYGRNSDETALLVIRTAREVLGAARAELVLLGEESAVTYAEDAQGVRRSKLPNTDLVTGWRGRVFETTAARAHGSWAGTVVGRDVPRALLGIWREEDQEPFRRTDAALLQTVADSLADWLATEDSDPSPLSALRRRLLELGGDAKDMADALGMLAAIREQLETTEVPAAQRATLATDLREVEQRVVGFMGALLVEQRAPSGQLVATGRWRTP